MNGTLTITFLSDTCFSMPAALDPTVDTNVAVDALGLPTVPGKTLHGLLRDTWLSSRPYLDTDGLGYRLFGEPRSHNDENVLRVGDALVDAATRARVRWAREREAAPVTEQAVRDAFFTERMLTAENRETGAPRKETLRVLRVVPSGTVLTAPLQAAAEPGADWDRLRALLDLVLSLTRHAGMDRNRGLGHIVMGATWSDAAGTGAAIPDPAEVATGVRFLRYRMRLNAPALISQRQPDPNSRMSRPYLSGAAIRGAAAALLLRAGADESDLHHILNSGDVRFLNAYPVVVALGETPDKDLSARALPTPITWQRNKSTEDDTAAADIDPQDRLAALFGRAAETSGGGQQQQRQPLQRSFYAPFCDARHRPATVKMRRATHQQRPRSTGTVAEEGEGTVFAYDAIAAGQTFEGQIALPTRDIALRDRLVRLLSRGPLWLGRSGRSGYGGAPTVEFLGDASGEADILLPKKDVEPNGWFAVRLTSDAVLRNPETGQHDPWFLEEALKRHFESLGPVEYRAAVRATTVQGYNRLWRTELPAVPAVAAGSVALVRAPEGGIPLDSLRAIQTKPIGERTAEGFGCFVITDAPSGSDGTLTLEAETVRVPDEPNDSATEMLTQAQKRLFMTRLRILLAAEAIRVADAARGKRPSASLIGRLRVPLRLPGDGWRETYADWFNDERIRKLQAQLPERPRLDMGREEREKLDAEIRPIRQQINEARELSLKPLARRALESVRIEEYGSLSDLLKAAVRPEWKPTLPNEKEERAPLLLLLPEDTAAQTLWDEAKEELCVFYLDMLLTTLAGRKKSHREAALPVTTAPVATAAEKGEVMRNA